VKRSAKQEEVQKRTIAKARHWSITTTRAENHAVYRSSAKDYEAWYERENDEKKAS
jgi:hypothetical protein